MAYLIQRHIMDYYVPGDDPGRRCSRLHFGSLARAPDSLAYPLVLLP
jgi:hypothetical protein